MFKYFLIFLSIFFFSFLVLFINFFLFDKSLDESLKKSPFECGFIPSMTVYSPFSMQFFLVALIFLIFDVELVLLFPVLSILGLGVSLVSGFILLLFLFVLSLGLFLEWSQSVLEWSN